jgi:two-component system, NtrC family, sensor kinase
MKKFFALLLVIIPLISFAQNNLPPVFEIKTDTALHDTLPNSYWQMLEDKEGKLSFEQVSKSPIAEKFHYDTSTKITHEISAYWVRFILKNVTDHKINIGFYDPAPETSNWYIIKGNRIINHKTSGFETPWSKNDGLKLIGISFITFLPLTIEPGEELLFYNRTCYDYFNSFIASSPPQNFLIIYGFTDRVIAHNYIEDESHYFNSVHDAFLFGAMLLAAIFNFLFFLIVRERVYLYFALYVFFLGFGRFNIESEFYHVFLREHPLAYAYLITFIWLPIDLFLSFFIRSLLETKKYYPRWDKFIFSWTLFYAASYIISIFLNFYLTGTSNYDLSGWTLMLPVMVLHASLLVTFFLYIKQNISLKRWLLLAILPSFTVWVLGDDTYHFYGVLQVSYNLQPSDFIIWLHQNWCLIETICLCWHVLFFSWFLMHRFV